MIHESSVGQSSPLDYESALSRPAASPAIRAARTIVITLMGLGLLLLVLLPSLCRSSETANRIKCAANLKSLGQAMMLYANEHGGMLPESFEQMVLTVDTTAEVLVCPSSDDEKALGATAAEIAAALGQPGHVSYVYAGAGSAAELTAETVLVYENLANHAMDGINVLYGDGHVDFLIKKQAEKMISELKAGHNPPRRDVVK